MGAYRKLLFHNEVVSGEGANCINDITNVLYVSSNVSAKSAISANQAELETLSNLDFENQIDYSDLHLMNNCENSLKQHSMAYQASTLEETVIRKIHNKGKNSCSMCLQVFCENEITDDMFIEYKSETSNILPPCKSTIELMNTVDNLPNIYKSHSVSFNSIMTHISQKIDIDRFYDQSSFEEHDHKHDFIKTIINSYMDI